MSALKYTVGKIPFIPVGKKKNSSEDRNSRNSSEK
jgi:hypothetical protein